MSHCFKMHYRHRAISYKHTYTISFCPKEDTCRRQLAQNTEFCILFFSFSLIDDLWCTDSGGGESSTRSMNLQKLSSWLSYLKDKNKVWRKWNEKTGEKTDNNLVKSQTYSQCKLNIKWSNTHPWRGQRTNSTKTNTYLSKLHQVNLLFTKHITF